MAAKKKAAKKRARKKKTGFKPTTVPKMVIVVRKKKNGRCVSQANPCKVDPGTKVIFYAKNTKACIWFKGRYGKDWPFIQSDWDNNTNGGVIELDVGEISKTFTVKNATQEIKVRYWYRCEECPENKGDSGGGSARIIIDP